jgi:hypothetical protein
LEPKLFDSRESLCVSLEKVLRPLRPPIGVLSLIGARHVSALDSSLEANEKLRLDSSDVHGHIQSLVERDGAIAVYEASGPCQFLELIHSSSIASGYDINAGTK